MQTIMIDGSAYPDGKALHMALKRMLALPEYYGLNADALNDCLSEKRETVHLWILSPGEGDTAHALETVRQVIADNGGMTKELFHP